MIINLICRVDDNYLSMVEIELDQDISEGIEKIKN
jgi:hypothetical protein